MKITKIATATFVALMLAVGLAGCGQQGGSSDKSSQGIQQGSNSMNNGSSNTGGSTMGNSTMGNSSGSNTGDTGTTSGQ